DLAEGKEAPDRKGGARLTSDQVPSRLARAFVGRMATNLLSRRRAAVAPPVGSFSLAVASGNRVPPHDAIAADAELLCDREHDRQDQSAWLKRATGFVDC